MTQWTLGQFYTNSLNPSVTSAEASEYERYISHPLNLPLVVSTETPEDSNLDFVEYLSIAAPSTFGAYKSGLGEGGVNGIGGSDGDGGRWDVSEEDIAHYAEFLTVAENPLDVKEGDGGKKRYKAYRQWLRGKSLFKQSKVDPEYQMQER